MRLPGSAGQAARAADVRRAAAEDRGSLILMLAVLLIALVALAGLVIDGGAKLDAAQRAAAAAQEAARAGAGMVNQAEAYSAGTFTVDQGQALAAARHYLATSGYQGTAAAVGVNAIRVTVTVSEPTKILSIVGIDSMTSRGSATAVLVTGVTGPGR
ncbi:MAG TPA: pilus assembly protein TadG-related protein [Streptosporangiaceae bacterium]|nr:pilus assembly protein TadG-related protein [Streptosporangiaceae bacterium]